MNLDDFVTLHDSAYVTPHSLRFTIHRGTQLQPLSCFSALTHASSLQGSLQKFKFSSCPRLNSTVERVLAYRMLTWGFK